MSSFFSSDRASKYGWGVLRLGVIVFLAFCPFSNKYSWKDYLSTYRWIGHAYIGSIGAYVNVEQGGLYLNILLLLGAAFCCYADVSTYADYTILVYLMKTFGGDFLAGKLDTIEWRLVLLFTFGIFAPAICYYDPNYTFYAQEYLRIFLVLFVIQVFCEYGDAHYEHWIFFRHRFSFEVANLLVLYGLPHLTKHELMVVQFDLFICWFYRFSNFVLIVKNSDILTKGLSKILFNVMGLLTSRKIQHVTDAALSSVIMKQFGSKGKGLETYLSCPSWSPVISLESIDGEEWKDMRKDFDSVMKVCPSSTVFQKITNEKMQLLLAQRSVIDADAIAFLTIQVFMTYVFGPMDDSNNNSNNSNSHGEKNGEEQQGPWALGKEKELEEMCNILVQASWEWRKEIAVRGKGDMKIKQAAIRVITEQLLPYTPRLWVMFGEKWKEPRYYSLILQPFIISPCVNTGDIMCSLSLCPEGSTLKHCMRQFHPFPIFERWVDKDVTESTVQMCNGHRHSSSNSQHLSSSQKSMTASQKSMTVSQKSMTASQKSMTASQKSMNGHGSDGEEETMTSSFSETRDNNEGGDRVLVSANTHCIMFTSDFRGQEFNWPIFGGGVRSCPGSHLATPFLKILWHEFTQLKKGQFQPTLGHKYSGRHLDGHISTEGWYGSIYFIRTIVLALYQATVEAHT